MRNRKKKTDRVASAARKAQLSAEKPVPGDKRVRTTFNKERYRELINDAIKWPLSTRVAAQLHRGNVTVPQLESWYKPESGLEKHVHEEFLKFNACRHAYNPEIIPPVLPIYMRKVDPEKRVKIGRPSDEQGVKAFRKFFASLKEQGWHKDDMENAYERLMGKRTGEISAIAAQEDEDWPEAVEPVQEVPKSDRCGFCDGPLNGVRIKVKEHESDYHMGCYYLSVAKPSEVQIGQEAFNPKLGRMMKFVEGKGWQEKNPSPPPELRPQLEPPTPTPTTSNA